MQFRGNTFLFFLYRDMIVMELLGIILFLLLLKEVLYSVIDSVNDLLSLTSLFIVFLCRILAARIAPIVGTSTKSHCSMSIPKDGRKV
ncbi:MAG: hypothetical protein IPJ20_00940 [Flammeovirgaceae bacterium]|nr:hypothetical protein [Flammeovirgaceae bacterium]